VETGLRVLHGEIDARARALRQAHGDWPCGRGCDACCRSLAGEPRVTRAEFELLSAGVAQLPLGVQQTIEERVTAMTLSGPVVCPWLDRGTRECLVYQQRPIACRSYGFYVERDRGLYCRAMEAAVERGEFADAVWGNAEGVTGRAAALGESKPWREWR
jgi:Fe-S-cluster containining protein